MWKVHRWEWRAVAVKQAGRGGVDSEQQGLQLQGASEATWLYLT